MTRFPGPASFIGAAGAVAPGRGCFSLRAGVIPQRYYDYQH